jgi:hypothetical protein
MNHSCLYELVKIWWLVLEAICLCFVRSLEILLVIIKLIIGWLVVMSPLLGFLNLVFSLSWVIVRYLGISFGVDLSLVAMWEWCLERLQQTLLFWQHKDLPFAGKLTMVGRLFQASHIYYVSCWLPSRTWFC